MKTSISLCAAAVLSVLHPLALVEAQSPIAGAPTAGAPPPICDGNDSALALSAATEGNALLDAATAQDPPDLPRVQAALEAFERQCAAGDSYALEQRARALSLLSRYLEAAQSLDEFLLQHPPPSLPIELRVRIDHEAPLIYAKVGTLRLSTNGFRATFRLDRAIEEPLVGAPIRVSPGIHTLRTTAPSFRPDERDVVLAEGSTVELRVELQRAYLATADSDAEPLPTATHHATWEQPEQPEQPGSQRWQPLVWLSAGSAIALLATGIAGTAITYDVVSDYSAKDCVEHSDASRCQALRDRFDLGRVLEVTGFAGAGALAIMTAVLIVTTEEAPPTHERATAGCEITATGTGLQCAMRF